MQKQKKIVAVIPARSGSKGIPYKNIIDVKGFPLIAYTIVAAKLSKSIGRVIVSTDDKKIAKIALKFGAEVPFLRPKKYATDNSTDMGFVKHAIDWFKNNEGKAPRYFVHLRPTTPLRKPELIDKAIRLILRDPQATALRSVHEVRESPHKYMGLKGKYLTGLFPDDPRPEYYNLPRQAFPPVYQPNGYVDILDTGNILKTGTLHGKHILGFLTEDVGELDSVGDIEKIIYLLEKKGSVVNRYLMKNYKK